MIAQALRFHETSVMSFVDDSLDSEKLTIENGDSDIFKNEAVRLNIE